MRLLPLITSLAPFVLRGATKTKRKSLSLQFIAYVLVTVGLIMLSIAAYVRLSTVYGVDIACLVLGTIYAGAAVILLVLAKTPSAKRERELAKPSNIEQDPLGKHIPDAILKDPAIASIIKQITENPVPATAAAVTLGMLLGNQYLGDDK